MPTPAGTMVKSPRAITSTAREEEEPFIAKLVNIEAYGDLTILIDEGLKQISSISINFRFAPECIDSTNEPIDTSKLDF